MKNSTDETLDELRDRMCLPKKNPGETTCLMCGESFWSWDKKRNRRCKQCNESLKKGYDDALDDVYWEELDQVNLELDEDYMDFINDFEGIVHDRRFNR